MIRSFLSALQFLTVFPVTIRGEVTEQQVGRSAFYFPAVGVLQGLLLFLAARYGTLVLPVSVTAGLIVTLLAATNGAFHLDGLADTFDATAVKSTGDASLDRERRLRAMKDSFIGAAGTTALVLDVLLKYLFVEAVLQRGPWQGPYALLLMPVFSRWIMVPPLYHGAAVRKEGLAALFIRHVRLPTLLGASLLLLLLFCASTAALAPVGPVTGLKLFLCPFVALYAWALVWTRFCRRRFGGLTGDNLGAISEMAEPLFLAIMLVLV